MSFIEHLEELRRRILICFIALVIVFLGIYLIDWDNKLVEFFLAPMNQAIVGKGKFQFTSPAEGFIFDLKIVFFASIFFASPMIFYQFWKFIAPALYKNEKRYFIPFILLSIILFVGGASFGYFVVFPVAFKYFAKFAFEQVEINPKLNDYFSFAVRMLFGFGLVFEFPLISVFLAKIGLIDTKFLNRNRKYAIIVIFTLAAILTPGPDVISQLLLAGPLWLLYELSIFLVWIFKSKETPSQSSFSG